MRWLEKVSGWLWANLGNFALLASWIASFALPAWAVKATNLFNHYGPVAWVVAGFVGMAIGAITFRLAASARARWIRASYDARMLPHGALVDPMAKTFEGKRIYLNEFALPSHPIIEGKTFIDCEIIGPANVYLQVGNSVSEPRLPFCDAVLLDGARHFVNGYFLRNCTLRGCSFQRVTWFIAPNEYEMAKHVDWLNWITSHPGQGELPLKPPDLNSPPAAPGESSSSPMVWVTG
jgi:hypothetical protein